MHLQSSTMLEPEQIEVGAFRESTGINNQDQADSSLPQFQDAFISPSCDKIPVRMMTDTNRSFLSDLKEVLQVPALHSKAIQRTILSQAVQPLPSGGHPARNIVTSLPLTRLERFDYLHNAFDPVDCRLIAQQ